MKQGLLILLSAPSGAGKTSLVEAALQRDDNLVVSVSHTTRPKRPLEEDGLNYHFVPTDAFQEMVSAGLFLEHALVFGNHYGTSASSVQALRDQGRDVILEIDWQGASQVKELIEGALSIFVLPPSEQALRVRLTHRGQDSQETIQQRLSEARLDMSQAGTYQYIVVNDDFDMAVDDLLAIVRARRLDSAHQIAENPSVQTILSDP